MSVTVTIGPIPAASAQEFIRNSQAVLAIVRAAGADTDFDLPDDVAREFAGRLEEWLDVASAGAVFEWRGAFEALRLRRLVAYWFHLAGVISGRSDELGLPVASPQAEPFYHGLVAAVTEALARADDPEHVGERARDSWPGISDAPHEGAGSPANGKEPGTGRIRTVVVDDTDDIRLLLRIALGNDPRFEIVAEAANGAEAVEVCARLQPDVVLLDLAMPVMDGLTALPRIRDVSPRSRVVIHTARDAESAWARCRELGASAIVEKATPLPSVADALASAVA